MRARTRGRASRESETFPGTTAAGEARRFAFYRGRPSRVDELMPSGIRNLIIVLGDQLDERSVALERFDPERDVLWMAEAHEEVAEAHQLRAVFFLSSMRHYAEARRREGATVHYHELTHDRRRDRGSSFEAIARRDVERLSPERILVVLPGDIRVLDQLESVAETTGVPLEVLPDRHFYCDLDDFRTWATGKKSLVLEHFYRKMRKEHDVLMDDGKPLGGQWNFDQDNRRSFGGAGPPEDLRPLPRFEPDMTTHEVIDVVKTRYDANPGNAEDFSLPVTPEQARTQLDAFIEQALPRFGEFQDAMAMDDAVTYHSRLSALLNVELLDPRACVDAAVRAGAEGRAPLNSVEGFVRQILGWREFVRGIYWTHMPEYAELNALQAQGEVPSFFWDGETDMACIADSMRQLIALGYVHHIHRLMVFGLFAQLAGVHPHEFHRWHMAMYVDAIDWVSLPNALGMSQYGDGGIVGTKPYVATGKYIQRMGPYCRACRYDPEQAEGDDACPFTTLYWDFLARHADHLRGNRRMAMQLRNLDRKSPEVLERIRARARGLKAAMTRRDRI